MERKLAEFRARKKAQTTKPADRETKTEMKAKSEDSPAVCDETPELKPETCPQSPQTEGHLNHLLDSSSGRWLQRLALNHLTLFKVLLWLVLLGLFAELEFGLPFFVISMFYWIYEGLRSPKAREPGEMSAYSVFNPDCQPILGTLTAEQLEGEMGYRPIANR